MRVYAISLALSLALLAGCGSREEEDANAAVELGNGVVSISAPGFNMSVDVPGDVSRNIEISAGNETLYPEAKATGITMTKDATTGLSRVNIGFDSGKSVDEVAKWYIDPHRPGALRVTGVNITDGVQTMSVMGRDGQPFNVVLKPDGKGGTDGKLLFRETH